MVFLFLCSSLFTAIVNMLSFLHSYSPAIFSKNTLAVQGFFIIFFYSITTITIHA